MRDEQQTEKEKQRLKMAEAALAAAAACSDATFSPLREAARAAVASAFAFAAAADFKDIALADNSCSFNAATAFFKTAPVRIWTARVSFVNAASFFFADVARS